MKRMIILSDTHGLLRPEVLAVLPHADIIIHGGDINTQAIVDTPGNALPQSLARHRPQGASGHAARAGRVYTPTLCTKVLYIAIALPFYATRSKFSSSKIFS